MTFDCPCSKAAAMFALAQAAHLDDDGTRVVVHSLLGNVGRDWELVRALEAIEMAETIAWRSHDLDHELAVTSRSGNQRTTYCFDAIMPTMAEECAS